jgi:ATP-binding cassette subfamily B protein RaxB
MGKLFTQFRLLKPQLKHTQAIMEATSDPPPHPLEEALFQPWVKVEGVGFRYAQDTPWIYKDFHLRVAEGAKHRIPGPSGSGKTTLLRLLAGLLPPEAGSLRLGGLRPREARPHFIYLPQGVRLFEGSLLGNLHIFSCGAPRERLLETAQATGLAAWVSSLPMGWETWVSIGGGNYSGGQRQLVVLTGVLASGRQLLLLDEAMANLDPIHQAKLLSHPLFEAKTILYAGHGSSFSSNTPKTLEGGQ